MDNIKSPRFILAAIALLATVVLAVLGKIDGSTAVGTMLGLAVGSGAALGAAKKTGLACLALLFTGTLLISQEGCTTTATGQRQFDPNRAMAAACAITPAANNLHLAICSSLSGTAKEDCLKAQRMIQTSSQALLGLAAGVYGNCERNSP